jgi:hypothetical protein
MTEDVLDAPHQASQGGKKQKIKLVKFQAVVTKNEQLTHECHLPE